MDTQYKGAEWEWNQVKPYCYPQMSEWPTTESYLDLFWFPDMCEFTVQHTLGPNAYVWGYLAARP